MLARDLSCVLEDAGDEVVSLDLEEIDIARPDDPIRCLLPFKPAIVVNCAAYTAVDRAETESETAFAVNRDGVGHLASACRRLECPMVHISTDYVFDGTSATAYREEDPTGPLCTYGKSKWEGEGLLRQGLDEHLIVRTSWLFGEHGASFVKTIHRLAWTRDELRIVSDQYGCPTWTMDLSRAIVAMCRRIETSRNDVSWGTYHFSCEGPTTWYGFAKAIVGAIPDRADSVRVVPISTAEYPTPALRPARSVLDCSKIVRTFGVDRPHWMEGLTTVLSKLPSLRSP